MTRRALIPLVLLATLAVLPAAVAAPAPKPANGVPRLIFPVLGPVAYTDDFGAPRGSMSHQGNDLMAPRRAIAVAAEGGTVTFWTKSTRAGCMLTLKGNSGTEYVYIHLNNDRTDKNDNKGGCVAGVAYAKGLKNGSRVAAGDPVGFVGNSGDADSTAPHLHFELKLKNGRTVSPHAYLTKARKLLFAAKRGTHATLTLRGTMMTAANGTLRMRVDTLRRWPGGQLVKPARVIELALPSAAVVVDSEGGVLPDPSVAATKPSRRVTVTSDVASVTLAAVLGAPKALTAHTVVLGR